MPNLYLLAVSLLGLGFGLLHRWHVSTLFENDRYFSHLSDMEREMSFRTEMGMYYSYYKTIVESASFAEGWKKISQDNISEHGNVIHAAKKYNLLPEVVAGYLYHTAKNLGLASMQKCWQVERGDGMPPVTNCEGLGVPVYFYLEIVWLMTIFTAATLFYYSTYLSNSVCSGLITILLFFYNHNECTRVQWTPPLRESFAYPMLLYQMYKVTMILREYSRGKSLQSVPVGLILSACCATIVSLCSWQFSQFVFTTQTAAFVLLKWLKIIPHDLYLLLYVIHIVAVIIVDFSTDYRLSVSLYTCLLSVSSVFSYFNYFHVALRFLDARIQCLLEILLTVFFTKFFKSCTTAGSDDAHVFNILRSKLSSYRDFHTMLYTCSAEFDFLQYRTYEVIIKTLLLPIAILAGMLALYYWYRSFKVNGYPQCIEAEVAYNGLQTGAFIIMAVFIMRLKLFMNPHLCIVSGAVCAKRYLEKVGIRSNATRGAIIVLLIAGMSHHGLERFQEERAITGEYSNMEQEELFEWIKNNTPEHAVFAGKMSLMANLMLSTRRPIVNNPYYESTEMRDRTLKVYEIFSRKDAASVYVTLRNLKVDYIVLEEPLCLGFANLRPGCQMLDLWDMMDNGTAKAAGKPPLCPLLFQGNAYPFRRAFANDHYVVLQLDYSYYVEYKPKTSIPLHYQF